jgi:hypothetical protein
MAITKPTMKAVITMALTAVATLESTPCSPTFAKIATSAAKTRLKQPKQTIPSLTTKS